MKKSPGAAAVLSFFIPGLGQIYNGELGKGITVVVVAAASWMLSVVYIGFVILIPLWIWSMYDACRSAEKINTLSQIDAKAKVKG